MDKTWLNGKINFYFLNKKIALFPRSSPTHTSNRLKSKNGFKRTQILSYLVTLGSSAQKELNLE
jgi:hypothetical protein